METASEIVTDEIQDKVPEKHCLETENTKNVSNDDDEEIGVVNLNPKHRRIVYVKEFLLDCFRHPACSRKPKFFSPNLDCELSTCKKGGPFAAVYVTPRKKDDNRRKFPEDNISLRPHSGNFSSGCAPNLSPAHFPQSNFSRFQFHHEEPPKNPYERNNYRFNSNVRQDLSDRNRVDRERDREREVRDRDRERDRDSRENRNNRNQIQNPTRRQNAILWGPEAENQPEWTRRRTSYSDNKDSRTRNSGYNNRGPQGYHRDYEEELEPEWFSGGPKSQHETIELHGFDDDGRRDSSAARDKIGSYDQGEPSGDNDAPNGSSTNISIKEEEVRSDEPNDMVLSIEKILKIDHIPGILPNDMYEDGEPAGSSRFSQLFQRNSSNSAPNPHEEVQTRPEARPDKAGGEGDLLQALFGPKTDANAAPTESKNEKVKTIETELRQILFRKNDKEEPKEPPKQEDLNAFKKLLEDLVIKSNKTVQQKVEVPAQDKGNNGPAVTGPPPGLHGMTFNPFGLGVVQPRPLQPHNTVVIHSPPMPVNQMMMHPLNRLVEQQQQQHDQAIAAQNQKRSGTPVALLSSFTPTAVMRKMTADQQTKTGASAMNENIATYNGLQRQSIPQGPPAFPTNNVNVNVNACQPNTLTSIMSAMANQSQHMAPLQPPPQPQQMPPQQPHPGHPHLHPHPHQPHVSLPPGGYHPSRVQFPVMVGPPNPAQFPPFMIYGPPVPQRK